MQSNSRLDFAAVEDAVQQLLEAGLAPSTRKTYAAGWKNYQSFTSAFSLAVFPIIHKKVTLFVVFLGTEKLSMSTVKTVAFPYPQQPIQLISISPHTPHKNLFREIARIGTLHSPLLSGFPLQHL